MNEYKTTTPEIVGATKETKETIRNDKENIVDLKSEKD